MKPFLAMTVLGALAILIAGTLYQVGGPGRAAAPSASAGASQPTLAAARQSVTLRVDGMFCPSCPYIVQRALKKTPGVIKASVSLRDESAVVTYDSGKTEVAALIKATTDMGYPSRVIGE